VLRIGRQARRTYIAGFLLIGLIGLGLWWAGSIRAAGPPDQVEPTATPVPGVLAIQVSSAYTTGGILFDGLKMLDGDIGTGWISDFAQPPQGQWIDLDLAPGVQVSELGLTNYTTAMRYSHPQTMTLQYTDGRTATLVWANTSQNQRQALPTPAGGHIRLVIDTIWGTGAQLKQPLGVAEIVPFTDAGRVGLITASTLAVAGAPTTLPTAPPITGPTSTSPDTVPVTTTATAPSSTGTGTEAWRWWLVGVMVILAGFFLLRGLRRQRGR
jgi:hypothetical protein